MVQKSSSVQVLRRKKQEREFIPFKPYAKIIEELEAKRDPKERRFTQKFEELLNLKGVYNQNGIPALSLKQKYE